ncbi:MAG: hypothetical protein ACP5I4_06955 [Oceanipulchritudo sp.]
MKQDLGTTLLAGSLLNVVLIPVIGYMADKVDRIKLIAVGICGGMLAKIAYFTFVQVALPDSRPEIIHIVLFGYIANIFGSFVSITFWPLAYDFIPREQMGTAQTGLTIVKTLTRFVLLNGVGVWIVAYSWLFLPEGQYDYFSGYLYLILTDVIGVAILLNFFHRIKMGKLEKIGTTRFEAVEET